MTTMVTGATGFVGSAVVRQLLAAQKSVAVLVRPKSNRANLDGLDVAIHEGDLTDRASLREALRHCDSLFHIAADYRLWCKYPQQLYTNNVDGTRNIMLAALDAGIERIVYTSSVATLGVFADGTVSNEQNARFSSRHGWPLQAFKVFGRTRRRRIGHVLGPACGDC